MRPEPWTPKPVQTIWVDYTTGAGVTSAGGRVTPKIGPRRKNPNLGDLLDTAAVHGATRIMLTGRVPSGQSGTRHWLLTDTPGWAPAGHWLSSPPTGRFERIVTQQKVEVRTVAEWFGELALTPEQARQAWDATAAVITSVEPKATLMLTPAATGTNLWAHSLPRNVDPVPVTADVAEEIHATSGQHHLEHLVAGENFSTSPDCRPLIDPKKTPKINTFAYTDGRFMYAALCRELGIGPARRLNRAAAHDLLENEPYARARILIKFKVPDTWNHVGIFGVQHRNVRDGWYYPNRPGATGETWADASEVHIGRAHGWMIDPLEAVVFSKARALDTFADRMIRARDRVNLNQEMPDVIRRAVAAALRAMVIQSIGAFASRGRNRTEVVASALEVPGEFQSSVKRHGDKFTYVIPGRLSPRNQAFYHPELAAQIWGRGRARVLESPTAGGGRGGALAVPADTLIGINGDAIYTTVTPAWALPDNHGGGDDGKTGRLRLQGVVTGTFTTPATLAARDQLRARAEKAGTQDAYPEAEAS